MYTDRGNVLIIIIDSIRTYGSLMPVRSLAHSQDSDTHTRVRYPLIHCRSLLHQNHMTVISAYLRSRILDEVRRHITTHVYADTNTCAHTVDSDAHRHSLNTLTLAITTALLYVYHYHYYYDDSDSTPATLSVKKKAHIDSSNTHTLSPATSKEAPDSPKNLYRAIHQNKSKQSKGRTQPSPLGYHGAARPPGCTRWWPGASCSPFASATAVGTTP